MTSERVTKVRMAELTGGEARALLAGRPVILLPMGSHEDQGPHAPMGDYLTAERMAEMIARRVNDRGVRCLVAPVVPFGGADYFGTMPGGIALSQPTLVAVLRDMLACLIRHGLTRLVFINGHAGNVSPIQQTTQEVYRAHRVLIPSFYLWQVAYRLLPGLIGEEKAKRVAGHGADPLTSVAWHLFPELMRPDLVPEPAAAPRVLELPISGFGTVGFQGVDVQVPVELDEIAPNGVFRADARLSSPETGKLLVDKLAAVGADFVTHYAAQVANRA
jgi:creatinine amidohydrolase